MPSEDPNDAPAVVGGRPDPLDQIDDESASDMVAPAHVVIQYRERGIPWLLVPPLVALSGAVAVVVAYSAHKYLRNQPGAGSTPIAARAPAAPVSQGALLEAPQPPSAPAGGTDQFGLPVVGPPAGLPPSVLADAPAETPIAEVAEVDSAPSVVANPVDTASAPPADAVTAIGFDPALLLSPTGEVARPGDSVDGSVAATRLPDGSNPAASAPAPPVPMTIEATDPLAAARAEPAQPAGVPANLLPPDPREARRRLDAEQWQIQEQERFEFHHELRAVCQQRGDRAAPAIRDLIKAYNPVIPPQAMEQAHKALGKSGLYYRADLGRRITLLRQFGFPEPVLVDVIFDYETNQFYGSSKESAVGRNVPSKEVMYLRAARILLNHPPPRPNRPSAAPAPPATTVPSNSAVR